MEPNNYGMFAAVYDKLLGGVSAKRKAECIREVWEKRGLKPRLVLDLACGTGLVTEILASSGIEMIGVDVSEEMLLVARNRDSAKGFYVCQDMRSFELYGTVDSIICVCDSLNYLLKAEELNKVFALARNYLNHGGVFMFDLNTEHKFRRFGDKTFARRVKGVAYIWKNHFDTTDKINEYAVTFFVKTTNGLYERFDETHYERAYDEEEVRRLLADNGFVNIETYGGFGLKPRSETDGRIVFVAERV